MTVTWIPQTQTSVTLPTCPACGCVPHQGGVAACPLVQEVEFHADGRVKRIVKK